MRKIEQTKRDFIRIEMNLIKAVDNLYYNKNVSFVTSIYKFSIISKQSYKKFH